jgi:hypothetical protein
MTGPAWTDEWELRQGRRRTSYELEVDPLVVALCTAEREGCTDGVDRVESEHTMLVLELVERTKPGASARPDVEGVESIKRMWSPCGLVERL